MWTSGGHDVDQHHFAAVILQIVEVLILGIREREARGAAIGKFTGHKQIAGHQEG
jgi:hypothetical protein